MENPPCIDGCPRVSVWSMLIVHFPANLTKGMIFVHVVHVPLTIAMLIPHDWSLLFSCFSPILRFLLVIIFSFLDFVLYIICIADDHVLFFTHVVLKHPYVSLMFFDCDCCLSCCVVLGSYRLLFTSSMFDFFPMFDKTMIAYCPLRLSSLTLVGHHWFV